MVHSLTSYIHFFASSFSDPKKRKFIMSELARSNKLPNDEQAFDRKKGIDNAIDWLLRAQQEMKTTKGIGSYHLVTGWTSPYPETTGYIIPTLIDYGIKYNHEEAVQAGIEAADWLISIQKSSGGWQGMRINDNKPEVVFNTAQVVRGLVRAYQHTDDKKYIDPIRKACDWLCDIQHHRGYWDPFAYPKPSRAFDSYVDIPLLMAYEIIGDERYKRTANLNLNWVIYRQQNKNGWFTQCDNTKQDKKPCLHPIAYTIDGLIDGGVYFGYEKYIDAAKKASDMLLTQFHKDKYLHNRYNKNWNGSGNLNTSACAQMAIVWMKFYQLTEEVHYLNAAKQINTILLYIQDRKEIDLANTKGALPGSFPIWGRYEKFAFPNWATKFLVDSLMLEEECSKEKTGQATNMNVGYTS
jgi:hypothetical protein